MKGKNEDVKREERGVKITTIIISIIRTRTKTNRTIITFSNGPIIGSLSGLRLSIVVAVPGDVVLLLRLLGLGLSER